MEINTKKALKKGLLYHYCVDFTATESEKSTMTDAVMLTSQSVSTSTDFGKKKTYQFELEYT